MKTPFSKIAIGIIFFTIPVFSVFCQNSITDIGVEIKKLLQEGKIPFEVLDSVEVTVRETELTYKFAEVYRENFDVFNAYFDKIRNKQKAKYPKNKILSKKEFLELMNYQNNIKLLPSQIETVEVIYTDNNCISFKSDGKLAEIMSIITYQIETNTFHLDNRYRLPFVDFVNVETNTNAFQEAWVGYNWEFAKSEDIDLEAEKMPTKEILEKISIEQYKITLGKLSSGKTVMMIKLKDFREGNWVVNVEIAIRMK